jgi:hypothetical protein
LDKAILGTQAEGYSRFVSEFQPADAVVENKRVAAVEYKRQEVLLLPVSGANYAHNANNVFFFQPR